MDEELEMSSPLSRKLHTAATHEPAHDAHDRAWGSPSWISERRPFILRSSRESLSPLDRAREVTRLGAGTLRTRTIDESAWGRAQAAFRRLVTRARRAEPRSLSAVATSAIREAENGVALCRAMEAEHGVAIEVLPPEEEARLVWAGVRASLGPGTIVVVDVGGGSVAIGVGAGRCERVESLPLGALRLRELLVAADAHVSLRTASAIEAFVAERAAAAAARIRTCAPERLVFTGDTARTLAALTVKVGSPGASATALSLAALHRVSAILSKFRPTDMTNLGVEEARSDTIAPGAAVLCALMRVFGFETATVSKRTMREGVALRDLSRLQEAPAAAIC